MKRLMSVLTLLFILTLPAFAADVKLAWDPMPASQVWTEIRVYEVVGTNYNLIGTVTGSPLPTTFTITNVSSGTHTYVIRSFNGQSLSVDSNTASLTVLSNPLAPGNLTITVIVK